MRNNKPRFSSIYNNILYGSLLSLSVTGIFLYLLTAVGRFSKIESKLFSNIILVIILTLLIFNLFYFLGFSKRFVFFRKMFFSLGILLLVVGSLVGFYTYRAQKSLDKLVVNDKFESVDYAVIGFNAEDSVKTMDNGVLGYIEHDEKFDVIMRDAVRPHSRVVKYMEYPDYHSMLEASLQGQIQFALVPKDFSRLDESFDMEEDKLPLANAHSLFEFTTKIEDQVSNVEVLSEPFTVLLLGNNGGLSDSIILATINPQTLNVTMTSLARDLYLPIACYPNQGRSKLNHARSRGRQCIEDTIENFLNVEIDFYFETDFYALEKIVDALGGIELESPIAFGGSLPKEDNPKEYHEIFIPKGMQKMDGKQAITFARERKRMPRGDFDRQMNQQYVIREVATKMIKERNPEKLVSALEGASQNIRTNISVDTMTKLLGFAIQQIDASTLEPLDTFRIESSQIVGTTPMIGGMSVIVPYVNDVKAVQQLMNDNLVSVPSLKNIRNFNYSINEPYKTDNQMRSKYGDSSGGTIPVGTLPDDKKPVEKPEETPVEPPVIDDLIQVPNFTDAASFKIDDLEKWAAANGIKLKRNEIESVDGKYIDGQIIHFEYSGKEISKKHLQSMTHNVTYAKVVQPEEDPKVTYNQIDTLSNLIKWAKSNGINIKVPQKEDPENWNIVSQPKDGSYTKAELEVFDFKIEQKKTDDPEGIE